jgi:hypothetical protein
MIIKLGSTVSVRRTLMALGGSVATVAIVATMATVAAPSAAADPPLATVPSASVPGLTAYYNSHVAPELLQLSLDGKLLEDQGNSHAAGTTIDLADRAVVNGRTQASQVWQFLPDLEGQMVPRLNIAGFTAGGAGQLRNMESGLCLQLPSYNPATTISVTQAACDTSASNGTANQRWLGAPQSGGGFSIQSALGSVYLGFNRPGCGSGAVNGDVVVARDPGGCATWQISNVLPEGGDPVQLTFAANSDGTGLSSYVVDSNNPSGAWGVPAVTNPLGNGANGTRTQVWYKQLVGEVWVTSPSNSILFYRYVTVPNDDWTRAVCLDAFGGGIDPGTVIDTYGCDPNGVHQSNQLWGETSWFMDNWKAGGPFAVPLAGVSTFFPVISEAQFIGPRPGAALTLQPWQSTVTPGVTQVLHPVDEPKAPNVVPPPAPAPVCVGYGCLIGAH